MEMILYILYITTYIQKDLYINIYTKKFDYIPNILIGFNIILIKSGIHRGKMFHKCKDALFDLLPVTFYIVKTVKAKLSSATEYY